MKIQTYFLCLICIAIAVAVLVILGFRSANPLVPAIVILAGIAAVYFCRRRVTDVVTDDLSEMINGKAAVKTLEVVIIALVIIFLGTTTYFSYGGHGSGTHVGDDGSTVVSFMQFYPPGNVIYIDNYSLEDPPGLTGNDLLGLERLFVEGHKVRDFPYVAGAALGFAAVVLAAVFAAFSLYYSRKYGCNEDEEQD
ncbi:Protein of unknown function DUF2178, transmembrane [Methanolacinia petrolearia DSM 11571]|uniref:Uncharacterized protein n=1 Tax=Methanolacinia petrolearia (strain DSM 11571 / OCM 486 / SEBR 4847) TaxID=679926 RepID=E1RH50_METP4|nr:DUF2178 domain-containing protein [Methanolacinia petrolearia]ADN35274.1 Protein of unknown function DUF2178, transmembrane [Methanolacinia petrolearia DSM 11571]